ncbi:MAG: type II secretion system protein, partial [Synergistaceae bacterium]|nr:type II secretion system protein [Synergistaceae bacterium]
MKNIKRKGFTLVELLIVIVVIGILSAMMMLSSTEA